MPQIIAQPAYLPPPVIQTQAVEGNKTLTYYAAFTVNGVIFGFDIRQNAYGETNDANATIRVVPWASTYTVVAQIKGLQPRTRTYRAVLYTEQDYLNLQSVVNQTGILQTAREPNVGGTTNAILMNLKRDDLQNPSDATGELTVQMTFQMLV